MRQQPGSGHVEVSTATRHQREVGAGYFDLVSQVIGSSSTLALRGSTEEEQF